MGKSSIVKILIAGNLSHDYIIDTTGKAHNNIPGGHLLYAASGCGLWSHDIGLISRIDSGFPSNWLTDIESLGFNTQGILTVEQKFDSRRFLAWRNNEISDSDNPIANYARCHLPFPHDLLGYQTDSSEAGESSWTNISTLANRNYPPEYVDVTAAHLCPLDFMTHVKLPAYFHTGPINTLTISPATSYMIPSFLLRLPAIIKGLTAFLPSETQMISLFRERTQDLYEMAESIAEMGCSFVVISRGVKGFFMLDSSNKKRYEIPFYPTQWIDPTGYKDVFAGAFLGEYKNSYDPLRALIHASVAAAFSVEGTGPFYCLNALPELIMARVKLLEDLVKSP